MRAARPGGKRVRAHAQAFALLAALDGADASVTLEVDGHAVAITHLDRVYWPAEPSLRQGPLSKRDFLRYLVQVAPSMLAHMADRPLTLFRWPNGVTGRRVLQKHWEIALPAFVERVRVFSDAKGRTDEYVLCNNLATLLWLAHMGTLEFHMWHSRVVAGPDMTVSSTAYAESTAALQASVLEHPDYILFDLDPFIYAGTETRAKDPDLNRAGFARVQEIALALEQVLRAMSLQALVKTSGKSGLHAIVPIRRTVPYRVAREIAREIGRHLMREHPGMVTMEWAVDRRSGKVFMDYNMNVRGKSITVPYSPRGLPGAPVSMPLTWDELPEVYPTDFRITTAATRLAQRGDPWRGWLQRKQPIEARLGAE